MDSFGAYNRYNKLHLTQENTQHQNRAQDFGSGAQTQLDFKIDLQIVPFSTHTDANNLLQLLSPYRAGLSKAIESTAQAVLNTRPYLTPGPDAGIWFGSLSSENLMNVTKQYEFPSQIIISRGTQNALKQLCVRSHLQTGDTQASSLRQKRDWKAHFDGLSL